MAEIKNFESGPVIDYMARDYDSLLSSMRSLVPYKLPEWKDYQSEADFGNVLLQMFAHMGDILSYYQDRIANESFLGTARERGSIIQHLRLIGYRLSTAAPASTFLDITVPADCDETVTITKGDAFATKSQKDESSIRFEYTGDSDLVIDFSAVPVLDEQKTFSGVPVEEGRLVTGEIVGESGGTPNQRFSLVHTPLILRSFGSGRDFKKDITLLVQLGGNIEEWTLRESLAFSKKDQTHYVIEIDEHDRAELLFGDGEFGAIPPPGAIVKATYRVGGGIHGNVPAQSIDTIVDAPELLLLGAVVFNPGPAVGGADRQSIEHAVKHAPAVFRSYKRAVTAADYRALALDFNGVGKVRAEKGSWNAVTLYVAPQGGGYVSDVLKKDLIVYFEDKRPITTLVEVEDVDYVPIYVTAEVGVHSYYSPADVKEKVQAAGAGLLAFENVDFAQTLYISKFYEAIEDIDGAAYVTITEYRRQNTVTAFHLESGKISLDKNEIPAVPGGPDDGPYSAGINVITL